MKSNLEMMNEIRDETYKQIEGNLNNDEFLITALTIYDKNNAVAINLFLTNTAIFMQESSEIEKLKKRLFIKIIDIKLTSDEFYIEFQNGYKIIGDTIPCQNEVNNFFECIKANTTIKASSMKELSSVSIEQTLSKVVPRINPFAIKESVKEEEKENIPVAQNTSSVKEDYVRTLLDDEVKPKKSHKPLFLLLGLGIFLIIGMVIGIVILLNTNKTKTEDPTIIATQARAAELLDYQVSNNSLYDYLFELTGYYEEYKTNFVAKSKIDVEKSFNELKEKYNKEFPSKYLSNSKIYEIYEVTKIDSWMNEDISLVNELFKLYETIIDEDYRNDVNIVSLESKLINADTKIRKTKDCLTEEKDSLKQILEKAGKNSNIVDSKENNISNSTKTSEDSSSDTTISNEDEMTYENEVTDDKTEDEPEGIQKDANYVSE